MKRVIPIAIVLLVLVAVVAAGWWYFTTNPAAWSQLLTELEIQTAAAEEALSASGFIEAEEFSLTAEVSGRISQLLADEGDEAEKGDTLVILDDALAQAQLREAQAAVQIAQAALAQVKAGPRPEAIRQAEAALAQAQAARDGAYQGWQDALAIRNDPQELEAQIDAARAQLEVAEYQIQAAAAATGASQAEYDMLARMADFVSHPTRFRVGTHPLTGKPIYYTFKPGKGDREEVYFQWNLSTRRLTSSWEAVAMAQAARDGVQAALGDLLAIRENPQELDTQVDVAKAQYERAEAAVQAAQAQLEALKTGATQEQIAVVKAQVKQAQAAADLLKVQLDKMTIIVSTSGLVMERTVQRGEMAAAGATGAVLLGAVLASVSRRAGRAAQVLIEAVGLTALFLPAVIFCISLTALAAAPPWLGAVTDTFAVFLLAYGVRFFYLPYKLVRVFHTTESAAYRDLEQMLGLGPCQRLRLAVGGLLRPALCAGWLLVFALTLGELEIAGLHVQAGRQPISIFLENLMHYGRSSTVVQWSLLLILTEIILALIMFRIGWPQWRRLSVTN